MVRLHLFRLELAVVSEIAEAQYLRILQDEIVGVIKHHWVIHSFVVSGRVKLNKLAVNPDITHV